MNDKSDINSNSNIVNENWCPIDDVSPFDSIFNTPFNGSNILNIKYQDLAMWTNIQETWDINQKQIVIIYIYIYILIF